MSLAKEVGEAVINSRREGCDPTKAILAACPGRVLFSGKVVDLDRRTASGFARGTVTIDGLDDCSGSRMVLEFQNENLIACQDGKIVCTVPDLISVIDSERGEPITTELMRYGFRVTVLGFPAPSLWTTPQALEVAGPQAFGYDTEFLPLTV